MKGEKNHRYGKKASEETKIKMSESALKGEKNNSSKLTKSDVLKIRELSKEGMYLKDISQKFGVSKSNIFSVVNRKTWKHI